MLFLLNRNLYICFRIKQLILLDFVNNKSLAPPKLDFWLRPCIQLLFLQLVSIMYFEPPTAKREKKREEKNLLPAPSICK